MKKFFNRALLACSLLLTGGAASAQGLQGVVVEEYYTITAADSTFIADAGVVSEAPPVGAKVYRVFVDMLPNYKFLTVTGGPAAQGNTLDFTTTTKFWNQDALADQHAGNTRFLFQNGQAFDSFITIHTTGKANGTSANCAAFGGGTGSFSQQVGVLKTEDTNANLTLCQAYTGFPTGSNDGNIPAPFAIGTAFSGFFTTTDFDALTTNTNTGSWTMVDDGFAITPPVTGVDPAGTNRVLIGQFTTDGDFSFHINVAIQNPQGVDEYYTWTNPNTGIGEQVSSFLTYPQVLPPDCNGVPGGPAVPGSPCNDLNICTTNDLWNASCQCVGTDISQTFTSSASACDTYTWAQNGQTYTASGTYTATSGCDTYVLNLTITPSTSNTTTASACDTYTWSVNGQTYTASGTYTSVTGCNTEILNLTITPSTSNTTTASACDSYTWSVNGQTYTASGTYTSVTGCNTEILNLTILTSGTNTTTASACDTYTWSVNGQTYTASGTYTSVTGCSTEILNLTITPSTSNTTTASACDSYTWSVNGQTYTASGTYTSVTGCNTEILNLTILTSGTNTTTASACDTYTWSVNGQTYTASGTYTAVTGCSTEILNLTITPSSSQSESATQCGTSYIWAVNGQSYNQSGTYTAVIGCVTYTLNLTLNVPGTPCDDGNNNTINDQLDLNCNCVGTPVGPGCDFNEVELVVVNDAVSLVSYEVRVQGTNVLTANGSVNPATGLTVQDICLPDGCYYLVVSDNGGDGIVGGGYVLRLAAGGRLIDNTGNMTVSPSQIAANEGFCLPLGADRLIATSCDKLDWRTVPCVPEYVVANANALVSAQYGVTNSTSGYQMWWYDPNGGYSFKRFQSHNTTNGLVASATRACHFKINAWTGNQLQEGVLYNVKVRGRVAGTYNAWGAACRFSLNNAAAQCPQARLNDIAGNQFFSCGVTRPVAANAYVYSTVVRRMQANCNWLNANRYQFRFRIPAESFELVKTSSTWSVNTIGLACDKTYEVDVRASFDNGASWCATGDPYGTVCTVTTTACSSSMTQETTGGTAVEARISMYPNPNRGDQVFLSIGSIEEGVETVSVDIFDAFGKRVSARTIAAQDGFVNSVVELNGELSAGFYLVNVTAGSASWSERLVVQP